MGLKLCTYFGIILFAQLISAWPLSLSLLTSNVADSWARSETLGIVTNGRSIIFLSLSHNKTTVKKNMEEGIYNLKSLKFTSVM